MIDTKIKDGSDLLFDFGFVLCQQSLACSVAFVDDSGDFLVNDSVCFLRIVLLVAVLCAEV